MIVTATPAVANEDKPHAHLWQVAKAGRKRRTCTICSMSQDRMTRNWVTRRKPFAPVAAAEQA